ncbi:tRNA (adenine(37)-N6)-methyltransferase isoform X3 [Trichechus manatus latirostris]|uniref:tRNA (Adenine(37)-N6)-methyltransferase isoform X3 n=1 Tax=Trichechus manatus latirostris TaxID=127582 RepID=A0A2Y9QVB8_TRIMA|nr:tRNA (adenine(37)-N6)-methyltransferase isoform X3 [Trichechus manatus latirostris]
MTPPQPKPPPTRGATQRARTLQGRCRRAPLVPQSASNPEAAPTRRRDYCAGAKTWRTEAEGFTRRPGIKGSVIMRGLEAEGPRPPATPCECVKPALEKGNLLTEPIGYLESCFSTKNGTPRQPSICSLSQACLKIRKSIFNNPEHSLMGLDQFSHVWILFVFHKNGRLSCKAKVQPPRLNGAKTGVFSTRSPHRPNAIGLTLAKLEKVEGGAIYLSGIDMVHGTPVLDIKPYIADYDSPQNLIEPLGDVNLQDNKHKPKTSFEFRSSGVTDNCDQQQLSGCVEPHPCTSTKEKPTCPEDRTSEEIHVEHDDTAKIRHSLKHGEEIAAGYGSESRSDQSLSVAEKQVGSCHQEKSFSEEGTDKRSRRGQEAAILRGNSVQTEPGALRYPSGAADEARHSVVPAWVRDAPVTTLEVRFTPHAEMDLRHLSSGGRYVNSLVQRSPGAQECRSNCV